MKFLPHTLPFTLAAASLIVKGAAVAPPHLNNTSWESVHALHRRLGITYDYQPSHVSSEHCRHLTEEQCLEADEDVAAAKEQRRLTTKGKNLRVLVLLCRFSDHGNRELPDQTYFETLFNGVGD